jgi:hypothetical protein
MIDPIQALLIVIITVLTIVLAIIGFQVFLILREFQGSIKKVNKMLDDMGVISEAVSRPIASLSENLSGASGIFGLLGWLARRKKKKETKESKEAEE